MKRKRNRIKVYLFLIVLGGFFISLNTVQAAEIGEQVDFYVNSTYDAFSRDQVRASLKVVGNYVYFYVENDYWNKLNITQRSLLREILKDLADEFDQVIYPKERAAFGSEWSPGIDNDIRITVLVSQLVNDAGGYFNTDDEYYRSQVSTSNQREMVYLNALSIFDSKNKSFLAHEFQHLISFYQKNKVYGIDEDVWLNEARSEYASTLSGYNDPYNNSYLANRVDTFLDNPDDPLGEWKNNVSDYGVVNLFLHYLIDHYGIEMVTQMTLSSKVGIASINEALSDLGYSETFSDVFADWVVANYLNDCQVGLGSKYCYLNDDLTYQRLHTDYSVSYSGFPNIIVSRSGSVKDWSPRWYRFRQGIPASTDRDTLKLEFVGSTNRGNFRVPYIVMGENTQTTVQFISLEDQKGVAYIPNFTSLEKTVIMIPFNQYKESDFSGSELLSSFSFTASSIAANIAVIGGLSPVNGSTAGGFEIIISGSNLLSIDQITFGGVNISGFNIVNGQTITFTAPVHTVGSVDIILKDSSGIEAVLANSFTYLSGLDGSYPDGSLLRAKGDYKVYIIKGNYRRWIQSAEIFNQYGHLRWEDIIEVDPTEMTKYQDAWLIRAANDLKVYEVNADGTKHWLNMTAHEFAISGRLWDMVYIVNSFERDSYITGSAVEYD